MIAGPNGSGKSSIVWQLAKERSPTGVFWLNHYLNPDDVERALVSTGLDLARFNVHASLADVCVTLFGEVVGSPTIIHSLARLTWIARSCSRRAPTATWLHPLWTSCAM